MSFDAPPPPPQFQPSNSSDDQTMIVLSHVLGIFFGFIPALIIMLTTKSSRVKANAIEALNFQISLIILYICGFLGIIVIVGIFVIIAAGVLSLVFPILAAIETSKGRDYRYPLSWRIIKG
jgi:uncharacterized Tic20 family protein